jgi:dihydropteroate synthase
MIPTVAHLRVPFIIMHMQGTPETMQNAPSYGNVVTEVIDYLADRIMQCRVAGITDVIADSRALALVRPMNITLNY